MSDFEREAKNQGPATEITTRRVDLPSREGRAAPLEPSPSPGWMTDLAKVPVAVDHRRRRGVLLAMAGLGIPAVVATAVLGFPWADRALNTVSTDDAYVNGHVTFAASRVPGQVVHVLVEDHMRVKKGQLLVQLDREPYQMQVKLKEASLEVANANLLQAKAKTRSLEGALHSKHWKLQSAIEQVDNQIAALKASADALESRQAMLERAQGDYIRAEKLFAREAISREELDQHREASRVAQAHVNEALAQVHEIRVFLGLPPEPRPGKSLSDVPDNLDETNSAVRAAAADLIQSFAEFGLPLPAHGGGPRRLFLNLLKHDASSDNDTTLNIMIMQTPAVKQAEAAVLLAQGELDRAQLDLKYCDIVAEIDGIVTRRNVNPGNNIQVGQTLMAIRSINEIWIDANFMETQLADLRIGQRVDLYVDMYGSRRVFKGRVAGFTMGTGSTTSLLPPENATGNFVKVVQRLPVRIELTEPNPEESPLFIGLSVVPYVDIRGPVTGPGAGRFLRPYSADATDSEGPLSYQEPGQ